MCAKSKVLNPSSQTSCRAKAGASPSARNLPGDGLPHFSVSDSAKPGIFLL
jgi:hypothetical protein